MKAFLQAKALQILSVLSAVLLILLGLSVWVNSAQRKAVQTLSAKLADSVAQGAADLKVCAGVNANGVVTIQVLGDELHACRGQEQKIVEQRDLALRQRARALKAAAGEAYMRREVIEAIARNDESCSRPICRALSDELLNPKAERTDQ